MRFLDTVITLRVCTRRTAAIFGLVLLLYAPALQAQDMVKETRVEMPSPVLALSPQEAERFTREAIQRPIRPEDWEDMTLLAGNHPGVVVPLLLSRIEAERKRPDGFTQEIKALIHIVAFAGEERALEGLLELALADWDQYGGFLVECLGYAYDRGKAFELAYLAAGRSQVIDSALATWVAGHVQKDEDVNRLMAALAARQGTIIVSDWIDRDPLLARLSPENRSRLERAWGQGEAGPAKADITTNSANLANPVMTSSAPLDLPTTPRPDEVEAKQIRNETDSSACVPKPTTLCLNNGRFSVTVEWVSPTQSGQGMALQLTPDTGYFWFFSSNNVEMVVKVLDGCSFNSRYWVFASGLTNVQVTMIVTDTQTGEIVKEINKQGVAFQPIQNTAAFATCP